jgi:hypothetical protein
MGGRGAIFFAMFDRGDSSLECLIEETVALNV